MIARVRCRVWGLMKIDSSILASTADASFRISDFRATIFAVDLLLASGREMKCVG